MYFNDVCVYHFTFWNNATDTLQPPLSHQRDHPRNRHPERVLRVCWAREPPPASATPDMSLRESRNRIAFARARVYQFFHRAPPNRVRAAASTLSCPLRAPTWASSKSAVVQ